MCWKTVQLRISIKIYTLISIKINFKQWNPGVRQFEDGLVQAGLGYTDVDQEGEWKLMDGELYDAGDRSEESIYYWGRGAPNNWQGIQHCAMVDQGSLNDVECSKSAHGSRKLYGLCEVCQMWGTKSGIVFVLLLFFFVLLWTGLLLTLLTFFWLNW